MTIINRYLFKQLVFFALVGVLTFTFILFLNRLISMADLVFNKGVPIWTVLKIIIFIQPSILVLTVPMSLLFSAILTFNRLSGNYEFVALKASGVSFYALLKPVFLFSFLTFALALFLMAFAMPEGNKAFRKTVYKAIQNRLTLSVREKIFNNTFSGFVLYVNEIAANSNKLRGILISDERKGQERIITAEEGDIFPDTNTMKIDLELKNGTIHTVNNKTEEYQWMTFHEYLISLDLPWKSFNKWISERPKDLTLTELKRQIAQFDKEGKKTNSLYLEFQRKLALPFACFILGLLGAPLGLINPRSGKSGGFVYSLIIIFLYYILLSTGENLGVQGKIPPILAMWTPNIILSCLTVYLVIKTAHESSFDSWFRFIEKIQIIARPWRRFSQ